MDASSMSFHNRLRNRKPHPGPGYAVPLAFAPIKLGKNMVDIRLFDSRSHVCDVKNNEALFLLGRNGDRPFR